MFLLGTSWLSWWSLSSGLCRLVHLHPGGSTGGGNNWVLQRGRNPTHECGDILKCLIGLCAYGFPLRCGLHKGRDGVLLKLWSYITFPWNRLGGLFENYPRQVAPRSKQLPFCLG